MGMSTIELVTLNGLPIDLLLILLVLLVGLGVGLIAGLFGIGGGFLVVPALHIILRIPVAMAVGVGACQVLGPATTSLLARRISREQLRLPLTIAGGLVGGVLIGATLLNYARNQSLEIDRSRVPIEDLIVLGTYLILLVGIGLFSLWEVHRDRQRRPLKRGWVTTWSIPPFGTFPEFQQSRMSVTVLSWFGLCVGLMAGLLGTSGGLILLPGLIYLFGVRTHKAVATSLVIIWIAAAQATIVHVWYGHINAQTLLIVAALLVGSTLGARLGSRFSEQLGGRTLRYGFGWLLLSVAVLIAVELGDLVFI